MKLLIVRHGETQFNAEHRYLGVLDPELNAMGIAQANELHSVLPIHLDAVVCSPLRRARQTADILCQSRGYSPRLNDAFRERNVGVFEGLTQEEARTLFPELWAHNVIRLWDSAPTGGQTINAVVERVKEGLNDLYASYAGKVVALVAHGFVAKVARAVCRQNFNDFFDWQLANGAVCELSVTTRTPEPNMPHAPWLKIALAEQGVRVFGPGASNPRISEYHAGTNIEGYDDKVSWCSSFVNWSLAKAGIQGTSSALARSWLHWGEPLEIPIVGCVTVLWRDDPDGWKGHVGFFQRIEGDSIYLLGGNQLEEVRLHSYPLASVLAYRWPTNAI